jgi:hypothetical protein
MLTGYTLIHMREYNVWMLMPVAAWSKALVAGIVGSNPGESMDVCLLCLYVVFCVGRGLCDGLITRLEESHRVSNCV